jgi:hypothetical protein
MQRATLLLALVLISLGDVARHTGSKGVQKQIVAQSNIPLKAVNFFCVKNVQKT